MTFYPGRIMKMFLFKNSLITNLPWTRLRTSQGKKRKQQIEKTLKAEDRNWHSSGDRQDHEIKGYKEQYQDKVLEIT